MKILSLLCVFFLTMTNVALAGGVRADDRDANMYMNTPHDNNFDNNGNGVDNIQPRDDIDMYRADHGDNIDSGTVKQDNQFDNQ